MKFAILLAVTVLFAGLAFAEPQAPATTDTKPSVVKRGRRPHRPSAGVATRRFEGSAIHFLNLAKTGQAVVTETATKMQRFYGVAVEASEKAADKEPAFASAKKLLGDKVAIAIVLANEGINAPTLAVYPEDRIAIINIDRLAKDATDEVLNVRVEKELWRAVAFTTGGYATDFPCALKPVASVADLDKVPARMTCPPVNAKVAQAANVYGIAKVQVAPYGVAVAQGWAPAPTNDLQKAVWDRVKAKQAKAEEEAKK